MRTTPILGTNSAVMQEVDHQKEFLCLDVQSCVKAWNRHQLMELSVCNQIVGLMHSELQSSYNRICRLHTSVYCKQTLGKRFVHQFCNWGYYSSDNTHTSNGISYYMNLCLFAILEMLEMSLLCDVE